MQPLERLVNLVALLLDSRRPLTFDEIRERMPEAYLQHDLDTAKRMFERDKGILRDVGVPIDVVATDAWDTDHGYTIPRDAYYLPEIGFTPEEISALYVAAHGRREASPAEEAVRKLLYGSEGGILAATGGDTTPSERTPDALLAAAADSVAAQRSVRFVYRTARGASAERQVDAYGLVVRGGRWYLVGLDRERGEVRSFRLSRVESDLADAGEGGGPPDGFRAADHVQVGPWGPGEPQQMARIAFSPAVAWWATKGVKGAETAMTREDRWVEALVPYGPGEGLASWVLGFGPDAVVLEPQDLRAEVVRRLEALIASS